MELRALLSGPSAILSLPKQRCPPVKKLVAFRYVQVKFAEYRFNSSIILRRAGYVRLISKGKHGIQCIIGVYLQYGIIRLHERLHVPISQTLFVHGGNVKPEAVGDVTANFGWSSAAFPPCGSQ